MKLPLDFHWLHVHHDHGSVQETWVRTTTGMLNTDGVAKAYTRLAPIYDFVFGPVFSRGRQEAVKIARGIGGRALEVGVGTGLSLPKYAGANFITGVDICERMLEIARERVRKFCLTNVESIEIGDAEALRFPSNSFDVVVAQYVVTACPNPETALDEFARVVRPGGEIVITTRISADRGMRAVIEKVLMPVTMRLGWRTEFPFSRYIEWAAHNATVDLVAHTPLPPLGHFSLIRFVKREAAANRSDRSRAHGAPDEARFADNEKLGK